MRDAARLDRLADDALLAAVALAEPHAVTVFVRRFQRRVYGLALVVTGDTALAEDVSQQAFERAWRHAAVYDPRRAPVLTWLLTITRNLAIDAIRVRRPIPVDPWTVGDIVDDTADPARSVEVSSEVERMRAALVLLPVEQRRAVVLATIGGRTTTEIGQIEGVPIPTAKTRLRTGLRRLRELTAEEVTP